MFLVSTSRVHPIIVLIFRTLHVSMHSSLQTSFLAWAFLHQPQFSFPLYSACLALIPQFGGSQDSLPPKSLEAGVLLPKMGAPPKDIPEWPRELCVTLTGRRRGTIAKALFGTDRCKPHSMSQKLERSSLAPYCCSAEY